jgi:hypothetical protein
MGCRTPAPAPDAADGESGSDASETGIVNPLPDCGSGESEDALVSIGVGSGAEVVDVEFDGKRVYVCGGFGADVTDVSDPTAPDYLGAASPRCQNSGVGPVLDDDTQVFYLTHHGDTWQETPYIETYHVRPEGYVAHADTILESQVSFEDVIWKDDYLYVATHSEGLRVYQTGAEGVPNYLGLVGGFQNAAKLELGGEHLYVTDGVAGVQVLSLEDAAVPAIVATIETLGLPRHLHLFDDLLYVALGGDGVEVYDVSEPSAPLQAGHLDSMGVVQAVARQGDRLAVAAWSHTAIYDANTFDLLATERTRPPPGFEQDLGVAMAGDHVFVGEWEGLHILEFQPGIETPDVWVPHDLIAFDQAGSDRVVLVENVGQRPLKLCGVSVDQGSFAVDFHPMTLDPGASGAFELSYEPPAPNELSYVTLVTNDPDPGQAELRLLLEPGSDDKLNVGDRLDENFAFLDPGGDLAALEGKVIVLAYFALF